MTVKISKQDFENLNDYAKNLKIGNLYTIAGRPTMGENHHSKTHSEYTV